MKIRTDRHFDDTTETLTVVETHNVDPVLDMVQQRKSAGLIGSSDKRYVGSVPFVLLEQWCREAGVSFDDSDAVKEVMHRKLQSGDFGKLRAWEGRY